MGGSVRTIFLVVGMVLLAVSVQGAVRLLLDHQNAGLLGWLPGGFVVQLLVYLLVAGAGIVLAAKNGHRTTSPLDKE